MIPRQEREELARVVRLRLKVAKANVAQRQAALLAEAEAQLSAKYDFGDEAWAEVTKRAEQAAAEADAQLRAICRERGIPESFRPALHIGWSGRGENAAASRRAELRKLAKAQVEAAGQAAVHAIEAKGAEVLTALIAGGLESEEARAFLESIPTAEQLMPPLAINELEDARRLAESRRLADRRAGIYS